MKKRQQQQKPRKIRDMPAAGKSGRKACIAIRLRDWRWNASKALLWKLQNGAAFIAAIAAGA